MKRVSLLDGVYAVTDDGRPVNLGRSSLVLWVVTRARGVEILSASANKPSGDPAYVLIRRPDMAEEIDQVRGHLYKAEYLDEATRHFLIWGDLRLALLPVSAGHTENSETFRRRGDHLLMASATSFWTIEHIIPRHGGAPSEVVVRAFRQ
jgi:hypothetical protein